MSVRRVSTAAWNALIIVWLICIVQTSAYQILFNKQTRKEQICRRDMSIISARYLPIYITVSATLSLCFIAVATYLLMIVYVEAQLNLANAEEEVYQMMDAVMTSLIPTSLLHSLTSNDSQQKLQTATPNGRSPS